MRLSSSSLKMRSWSESTAAIGWSRPAWLRSKHFNDQAERYATGDLREVYFYPEQLKGHMERRYRPGQ